MQRMHKTAALQQQKNPAKILQILLFRTENWKREQSNVQLKKQTLTQLHGKVSWKNKETK